MNQAHKICGLAFSTYHDDEVTKLSIKGITNPDTFDVLGRPVAGGLYDSCMGPIEQRDVCPTCGLIGMHCPGHMGHIDLPLPVYNPVFFHKMLQLLKATCFVCHRLRVKHSLVYLLVRQLHLLEHGLLVAAKELEHAVKKEQNQKGSNAGDEDGGESNPETMDTVMEEVDRIDTRYYAALEAAGLRSAGAKTRGPCATPRKYAMCSQARDELIHTFMGECGKKKTCESCGAKARSIIQEAQTKIIAKPLKRNLADVMTAKGLVEHAVLEPGMDGPVRVVGRGDHTIHRPSEIAANVAVMDESGDGSGGGGRSAWHEQVYIMPDVARKHLTLLWHAEADVMPLIFKGSCFSSKDGTFSTADMFFLRVLPVPANRFRPPCVTAESTLENAHTLRLADVLKSCREVRNINRSAAPGSALDAATPAAPADNSSTAVLQRAKQLQVAWTKLQTNVNVMIDAGLETGAAAVDAAAGIKQVLEKKEGLFRMHMMGKRVNYACRSVISPDPMIGTHEIGIPRVFAVKLTYPEPVTTFNVNKLREAVIAGPDNHPGATHVEDEFGNVVVLSKDRATRETIADQLLTPSDHVGHRKYPSKRVMRHIRNGDWVLANRQPTLHKASIMAHQARILLGERTLRLHYSNCKTYNADFDGDEMNVHFPQNEVARAEAATIANSHNQYISLGGSPLRGLIQDHVVSGFRMICRDAFYDRETYQQLLYAALGDLPTRAITLPPAILKPKRLWTGKQLVTSLLANLCRGKYGLNLTSKAQTQNSWSASLKGPLTGVKGVPSGTFTDKFVLEGEGVVLFRDGVMLTGVLDKKQIGSSANGLVHSCQEVYGNEAAGKLLSMLGKLFTTMVKFSAHTFGIEDVLLSPEADEKRSELLKKASACGPKEAAHYTNAASVDPRTLRANIETIFRDAKEMSALDKVMMRANNEHQSAIVKVTCPTGLLKPFPHNHLQNMIQTGAKGSSVNGTQISSLLGQQALEGKRVPVMISGKTLPSFTAFDPGARAGGMILDRFLTGVRPQEYYFHCMAGREGLVDTAVKTSRSGYLQRCLVKHLEDLRVHYDLTVRDADGSIVQFLYGEDGLDVTKTATLKKFSFLRENYMPFLEKFGAQNLSRLFRGKFATKARKVCKRALKNPEKHPPALSHLRPDHYFGCISEKLQKDIDGYVATLKDAPTLKVGKKAVTSKKLVELVHLKSYNSLIEPGEAVGVLAAQAIGEPSTQMTLNTFHFAGRSDMNVTLGIPRLREILMTASPEIKTPIITAALLGGKLTQAQSLVGQLRRVTLADVLQSVHVTHYLAQLEMGQRHRVYELRLVLVPHDEYKQAFSVDQTTVVSRVKAWLCNDLVDIVTGTMSAETVIDDAALPGAAVVVPDKAAPSTAKSGASKLPDELQSDEEADSDDDDEDAGTLMSTARSRRGQRGAYENDDDGDNDSNSKQKGPSAAADSDDSEADSEGEHDDDDGGKSKGDGGKGKGESGQQSVPAMAEEDTDVSDAVVDFVFDSDKDECTIKYKFPCTTKLVLFVSLIETLANKVVVRATAGINQCVLAKSKENLPDPDVMQADGNDLKELWKHQNCLDVNRIRTNNIYAMLQTYGVEAARASIVNEVVGVFEVYGIEINPRHLSLVADAMTQDGGYRAMNRMGLRSNASPLLKMSFETTFEFLKHAVLSGDHDPLQSSSARLVLGQASMGGTGSFSLLKKLSL